MGARRSSLLVIVFACAACSPHEAPPVCRLDVLRGAAASLPDSPADHHAGIAAAAILDACPVDGLRPLQRDALAELAGRQLGEQPRAALAGKAERERLWQPVCAPGQLELLDPTVPADLRPLHAYDVCEWQALGLIERDEVTAATPLAPIWGLYPYLRAGGVSHELGRALMRALLLAHQPS